MYTWIRPKSCEPWLPAFCVVLYLGAFVLVFFLFVCLFFFFLSVVFVWLLLFWEVISRIRADMGSVRVSVGLVDYIS